MKDLSSSKYWQHDLGRKVTNDNGGSRKFDIGDDQPFTKNYYIKYRSLLHMSGRIGETLNFYTDHSIRENFIIVFNREESFLFEYDDTFVKENGVDAYIGLIIKDIEEKYLNKTSSHQSKANSEKGESTDNIYDNPVVSNPSSATYEDLKEYLKRKNSL
jgi:hypothetical protein